jgi:hypothetical protein
MMKTLSLAAAFALVLTLAHLACNPDCESISNVGVSTTKIYDGYEIVIKGDPLDALIDRKVYFGNVFAEDTRFEPGVGLLVKVPVGISADYYQLKIEDPDCLDVIVVSDTFEVVQDGYFDNLGTYSPPIPPEIIIPDFPSSFPPTIDNAWLSPEDPGYCLWFIMHKDPITGKPTSVINSDSSFEQATCWCLRDFATSQLPYAMNRMSGVIEYNEVTKESRIHVFIDRTPIGGKLEEYTGQFIDINKTIYAAERGYVDCPDIACDMAPQELNDPPATGHLMLLTNVKTGKQLTAFQLVL